MSGKEDIFTVDPVDTGVLVWNEKIDAPEEVLRALVADNLERERQQRANFLDSNTNLQALMEQRAKQREQLKGPTEEAYKVIDSFSKELAPNVIQITSSLEKGSYITGDILDVLTKIGQAPDLYLTSIPFSGHHFLKAVSQYLPDGFWEQDDDHVRTVKNCIDNLEDAIYAPEDITPLIRLFEIQRLQKAMSLAAKALSDEGHVNLADIADKFALKMRAMSLNIIESAQTLLNDRQPVPLGNPSDSIQSGP